MTLRSVIAHNIEGRLFEWGMAFAMLCLAIEYSCGP